MSKDTSVEQDKQLPMRHHLETTGANRVNYLKAFVGISDLELLLKKDGSLLI